jgi:LmbE family N-acetylglucosaminyl deacetylase/SAM-dependent methyltransferase
VVTFTHRAPGTRAEDWASHARAGGLATLQLDPEVARLVVLAAHPDDESLGAGGLLAHAHERGLDVVVVVATDGESSHPLSPTHSMARLASIRRTETRAGLGVLAPGAALHQLGLPDGGLAQQEHDLVAALVQLVGDGRHTLVVGPWRRDGHPDHEAAGRAAATTAARTGARLLEYPIWFWHWGIPDQAPWGDFRAFPLTDTEVSAKATAMAAHRSQAEPLSEHPGDEAILSPELLGHFSGSREIYVAELPNDPALDDLHARDRDPWGTDSRWYETRKRSLLLAALPQEKFRHALEVGSSTGALAADLAVRCNDLLVVDASPHAAAAASERLGHLEGVRVQRAVVPLEWPVPPEGGFDLIVLSEVGYFLSPRDLDGLVTRVRTSLASDGVVVLCHWRHEVVGWPLDGPAVHETFTKAQIRPVVARYSDHDFELLVLAAPGVLPDPRPSP